MTVIEHNISQYSAISYVQSLHTANITGPELICAVKSDSLTTVTWNGVLNSLRCGPWEYSAALQRRKGLAGNVLHE